MSGDYIAIDWGTTNRRIFALRGDGVVARSVRDSRGVTTTDANAYKTEIQAIRREFGDMPIIMAGMVGSTLGLREIPYCTAPASLEDLATSTVEVMERVHIVPGISQTILGEESVMRGEEVQVFGALRNGLARGPALFCQPGTHNKWIETDERSIVSLSTAMTGELFALLKDRSVLGDILEGDVADSPAFREGLDRGAGCRDLTTALFGARASVLLGRRSRIEASSYVSGILIGTDVGAREGLQDRLVYLLSSGGIGDLYEVAIRRFGGRVQRLDSHVAFAAGIHAIRRNIT
ncbi:2-dehydro-3-deoxygalactonokinase [Qipengyuania sp.]|uniref:2-dehydro-3-deoxygalactonokinase n=1 Tax=Qipengyuania sp. TaxID=2004515 RepID=UPI003AF90049